LQQSFPCPKCGAQIAIGQSFCGVCGQRFEYRCRHCGTPISDSSGFCTSCGGKLSHLPRPAHPAAKKVELSHTVQSVKTPRAARQHSTGNMGPYLIVLAALIVLVGAVYFIGSSTQGNSSDWLGGYSFGGQAPPSTPPATSGVANPQVQKSDPVTSGPNYSVSEVISKARIYSPTCQVLTRRTG